jgi:hypothetical protein
MGAHFDSYISAAIKAAFFLTVKFRKPTSHIPSVQELTILTIINSWLTQRLLRQLQSRV